MPTLIDQNRTILWKKKEIPKIWVEQMSDPRRLFSIRRIDRMPNTRAKKLCDMKVEVD